MRINDWSSDECSSDLAFIKEVAGGDKRIVLVDGEVAGAINRMPGKGEIRSNLAAGGYAEKAELTDREREICEALKPELKKRGLLLVGIDEIGRASCRERVWQ